MSLNNVDPTYVIRKPIVTERSTRRMEDATYTFEVDRRATKTDIKHAIEAMYKVKVIGIRTSNRKGKVKRMKYGYVSEPIIKHAAVKLREGDLIEIF